MRRSQQKSCSQTHTSSSNGLLNFLRLTRGRLRISFRNTAIMPSSVTSCLWTGSCRTLETRGEFQQFMDTLWNSTSVLMHSSISRCIGREYPHNLPTLSVVLIYLDEALSVIQRAICSLINRTPAHLLKEIILVDDHSTNGLFLSKPHPTLVSDAYYSAQNELFILDVSLLQKIWKHSCMFISAPSMRSTQAWWRRWPIQSRKDFPRPESQGGRLPLGM